MWNKIQRIYIGDHYQVYPKWKPWANTILYLPLKENLNDYSGNNRNFTNSSWTVTYSNNMATITQAKNTNWTFSSWFSNFTILIYTTMTTDTQTWFFVGVDSSGYPAFYFNRDNRDWGTVDCSYVYNANGNWIRNRSWFIDTWIHLIACTKNSSELKTYVDGVIKNTVSCSGYNFYRKSGNAQTWIGRNVIGNGTVTYWNIIIEDKERTAEEIKEYYNQTKASYLWFN